MYFIHVSRFTLQRCNLKMIFLNLIKCSQYKNVTSLLSVGLRKILMPLKIFSLSYFDWIARITAFLISLDNNLMR